MPSLPDRLLPLLCLQSFWKWLSELGELSPNFRVIMQHILLSRYFKKSLLCGQLLNTSNPLPFSIFWLRRTLWCIVKNQLIKFVEPLQTPGKESISMQETPVQFLGWEDPLEKGTAIHSSILTWRVPVHGVSKSWTQPSHFHFPFPNTIAKITAVCHKFQNHLFWNS